tara:strand:- start:6147 stop:6890 length:744 start_codon:yes stop_codon:yes gene_type:complete
MIVSESSFYDVTPFDYGYSSKDEIIASMHPLLKKLMEQNAGKIFCDIGCGCGRNLLYASDFAERLIGVDLSIESLAYAKDFLKGKKVELIQGDNLNIPLEDGIADVVISDGVCHHTGNTTRAFTECIRILKNGGDLYLAVYKKYRYYPFIYYLIGGVFRVINRIKLGNYIIENIFVFFHYIMYRVFRKQKLSKRETRNIFYDYFITPIATFQSKGDVFAWSSANNCSVIDYSRTSGNCHVFIIRKGC